MKKQGLVEMGIDGLYALHLDPKEDQRGLFTEAYVDGRLWESGVQGHPSRVNLATSRRKGTIRGMHWQVDPEAQFKIVFSVQGCVFDAVVDVRAGSRTKGEWRSAILEPHVGALVVPKGMAHGWQALEDGATLMYIIFGGRWSPPHERGIRPDSCGVEWPIADLADTSERDLKWPTLEEHLGRL